jgi:hypothetical protein
MMKFPSASIGGTCPSGNSVAFTNPAALGSRTGAGGRVAARPAAGAPAGWAAAMLTPDNKITAVKNKWGFMWMRSCGGQERVTTESNDKCNTRDDGGDQPKAARPRPSDVGPANGRVYSLNVTDG